MSRVEVYGPEKWKEAREAARLTTALSMCTNKELAAIFRLLDGAHDAAAGYFLRRLVYGEKVVNRTKGERSWD